MTDAGRLEDPGQTTTAPGTARRSARGPVTARRVQADDESRVGTPVPGGQAGDDDVRDVADGPRGRPPLAPRALPDPGQDSTQRR